MNVSAGTLDLSYEHRRVLDLIYEPFGSAGSWPISDAIQRKLFRGGERKVHVDAVLAGLPAGLTRSRETLRQSPAPAQQNGHLTLCETRRRMRPQDLGKMDRENLPVADDRPGQPKT